MEAYNVPSRRTELEMYLAAQPDGWFALVDGSEIVSVGVGFRYGSFCWLGLVATKPNRQRQGLATKISAHLVDWARQHGSTTIALDASEAGRRVYEQLGFRVVGETTELSPPPEVAVEKPSRTVCCDTRDVERLLALDRRIFGGDRAGLLRSLSRQADARCHVAVTGDEVVGYLFVRNRLVGPGVARNADTARDLLRAALIDRQRAETSAEQRLLVPVESHYLDVASRLGFRIERRLAHMRLGDDVLPGERRELLAQTSYAAG